MLELNRPSVLGEVAYLGMVVAALLALPLLIWEVGAGGDKPGQRVIYLAAQNPPGGGNAYWSVRESKPDFFEGERDVVRVKEGERIVLRITSIDNVHGFSLPAFGMNEVVYPGGVVEVSFTADMPGEYYFSCTIFCGDKDHSKMKGRLVVEAP